MSKISAALGFVWAASTLLAGCAEPASARPDEPLAEADPELYGQVSKYWPTSQRDVGVCWEAATFQNLAYAEERVWIEDAVRRNWMRHARVNLVDSTGSSSWPMCSHATRGLRVGISSSQPGGDHVGLGSDLNNVANGLRLSDCGAAFPPPPGVTQEQCVRRIALHEFGHALGFYNEEERPGEGLPDCDGHPGTIAGGQKLGAYNPASLMSECGTGNAVDLSPGDIAAVQRAYGHRLGTLMSPTGRCVTTPSVLDEVAVVSSDCVDNALEQAWFYEFGSQVLNQIFFPGMCLASFAGPPDFTVQTAYCSGIDNLSKWRLQNAFLRTFGLCADLAGGNVNGGVVQGWECGALGGSNQRWTIGDGDQPPIYFGNGVTTSCLTVPASGSGQLTVKPCNNTSSQKFVFPMFNSMRIASAAFPSKCLDLQTAFDASYTAGVALPTNGTPIQLFDCNSAQYNQKWYVSGEIFNLGHNRCLQRDSEQNNAPLRLGVCNGSEAQRFDHYWELPARGVGPTTRPAATTPRAKTTPSTGPSGRLTALRPGSGPPFLFNTTGAKGQRTRGSAGRRRASVRLARVGPGAGPGVLSVFGRSVAHFRKERNQTALVRPLPEL
jgi:Ricin-type beta-trefoil lectin domain